MTWFEITKGDLAKSEHFTGAFITTIDFFLLAVSGFKKIK